MDDDAAHGRAALARSPGGREHDPADREIKISRRRDDRGVVAAELEQGAPEARGNPGRDLSAHPLRAGRAHERDARVIDERCSAGAVADDDLMHIGGRTGLGDCPVEDRGAGTRGERGELGGLPDDTVAADEGDGGVPGPDGSREVEG